MFNPTADISQYGPTLVLATLLLCVVLPSLVCLVLPYLLTRNKRPTSKNIYIFVFGDLGHSPRMCYHALSLAQLGYSVTLCGYLETQPPAAVLDEPNVEIKPLRAIHNTHSLPYLAFAVTKIVAQIAQLWGVLASARCSHIMLQNPPSMPLLAVVLLHIRLCSPYTKLIIDWHNLNYSILNLRYQNERHVIVRLMRLYERFLGRFAWRHITVTGAMKAFLVADFGFAPSSVLVLHDRPGPQFRPLAESSRSDIMKHDIFDGLDMASRRILVSSTSFTPDEDFTSLVHALQAYEASDAPPLLVIVTGKGPMKAQFLANVEQSALKKVVVRSAWLSSEDYPLVLSAADLAVSLHTSSSGMDLPMKILDFFGVGVPVVSLDFPAIGELVVDGTNGLVVPPTGLHTAIIDALSKDSLLSKLKAGALSESENRWNENWTSTLAPIFDVAL